jgi:DNA-binding transcriptional LysR family regulator
MDPLAAMETFIRVIESGSFSAAARGLNIGQPAVSKMMAQLENRLGARLLTRSTHGLSPTEAGRSFYERAKRTIAEADAADLAARNAGAALTGRLRVCAAVTFARLHIIPRLPAFLAAHPGLEMDIVLDDRRIDLVQEGVDVALRIGVLDPSTMLARRLASTSRVVVASPAYLRRRGIPDQPSDLADHDAIVYTQSTGGESWTFRKADQEVVVNVSGRLRVSAAEGLRAAVLAGAGLAVASRWNFVREIETGAVCCLLTDWSLPGIDLFAVYPAGRMPTAKARAFAAFIESKMAEEAGGNTIIHVARRADLLREKAPLPVSGEIGTV